MPNLEKNNQKRLQLLSMAENIAKIGHWEVDLVNDKLAWSDGIYAIHEVDKNNFTLDFESAINFYHPQERLKVREIIEDSIENKKDFNFVSKIVTKNGNLKIVQCDARVTKDKAGGVDSIFGVFQDITEQLEYGKNLYRSKLEKDAFIESSYEGYWDWHIKENYEYMSPRFWQILGYDLNEQKHSPESWHKLIFQEDLKKLHDAFKRHVESKGRIKYSQEVRFKHKNGSIVWVIRSGKVIEWNSDDQPVRMIGTHSDVTERKLSEEKIKESQAFLELMMQNNPDLIYVKDSKHRIVKANNAFINLYPTSLQNKILGNSVVEEYKTLEEKELRKMDLVAFEDGYSDVIQKMTFPDKEQRSYFIQKIRFQNSLQEQFILCIARDVTEREMLISNLMSSNEELEKFAYICSHDLQEPLRMIRSFADKLNIHLGDSLQGDARAQKYLKFLFDGAVKAQDLISDILSYSSLDNNTRKPQNIDVNNIITLVKEALQQNILASNAEISFSDLPNINGDFTQIYQLMQNLINNAIKYARADVSPVINISCEETATHWKFLFEDNGIGIKQEYLSRIFEIFERLHRSDEYQGTGIGLSICKKVVEKHSGKIWVESVPNKGSKFFFTIKK